MNAVRVVFLGLSTLVLVLLAGCGGTSGPGASTGGSSAQRTSLEESGVDSRAAEKAADESGEVLRAAYDGDEFKCPVTAREVSAVVGVRLVTNLESPSDTACGFITEGFGSAKAKGEENTLAASFSVELGNRVEENREVADAGNNDPELAIDCETKTEPMLGDEAFVTLCGSHHTPGDGYSTSAQYIFAGPSENFTWSVVVTSGGEVPTKEIPAMLDRLVYER